MRFLILALCLCHIATASDRWSRQLAPGQLFNDWVPISQEAKSGKSLGFVEDQAPAAQTQFQFFAEPLNNRFNLQQQHPAHPSHSHSGAPPEVNSYIHNNPPQFQLFNSQPPAQKQRTVQNFGGQIGNKPVAEALIQNPPQAPPFTFMQEVQRQPHVHHYQSQPIHKNVQSSFLQSPPPSFQSPRIPHYQKFPPAFQPLPQSQALQQQQQQQPTENDQPVQLLYVPFNSLYTQNQQQQQKSIFGNEKPNRFNILNQPPSASLINDFYSPLDEIPSNTISTNKPVTTKRPQTIAPPTASYKLTTPFETTSKLKPHQPPLSMFVANEKGKLSTETDVLSTLKNSGTIDVMDSIGNRSPKVFIGPSGMVPPTGYSKFDLPYLSSIDGTRNERKIDQLPFFVAPLSYKTPPGFSKIPLPAPHVGSVVVNQPNSIDANESSGFTPDTYYTKQPSSVAPSLPGPSNFHDLNKNINKNTQTVKLTSGFHYTADGNVQLFSNEFTFPTLSPSTTQSPRTTPRSSFIQSSVTPNNKTPLTKVKASVIQEQRNDYSTFYPTTTRTPALVTRTRFDEFASSSPSVRTTSRTPTTYTPIELDEHRTVNQEYFKIGKYKPTISTFDSYVEEKKPKKTDFHFKPIPEFNFESVTSKKPKIKPTTSTSTTTTKVPVEVSFPSSTPPSIPTQTFDYSPTVSIIENSDIFKQFHGDSYTDFSRHSTPRPTNIISHHQQQPSSNYFDADGHVYRPIDTVPTPHHTVGDQLNQFFNSADETSPTTENPNFNLPSELPPISAHLPSLVNSLMDDKWMHKNNITEEELTTTTTTTRRPTRGRRPTSVSPASSSTYRTGSTKNEVRGRRPSTSGTRSSLATTEATYTSRVTPSRSSKIRYNITSTDDQSRFRTRQNRRPVKKDDNIEYQRDVLNQNYPSSVRPPTTISTEQIVESIHIQTEVPHFVEHVNDYNTPIEHVEVIPLGGNIPTYNENIESQYTPDNPLYYENTIDTTIPPTTTTITHKLPKNHKNANEEFQIPQHKTVSHRLKGNFNFNRNTESFYNKDTTTTQSSLRDDEILISAPITLEPKSTTISTTTTEAPETEAPATKRTSFPRRRLFTTTPQPEQSETDATEASGVRFFFPLKIQFFNTFIN